MSFTSVLRREIAQICHGMGIEPLDERNHKIDHAVEIGAIDNAIGLCCITASGDSLCKSGSIVGRDVETSWPEIPHDELERV